MKTWTKCAAVVAVGILAGCRSPLFQAETDPLSKVDHDAIADVLAAEHKKSAKAESDIAGTAFDRKQPPADTVATSLRNSAAERTDVARDHLSQGHAAFEQGRLTEAKTHYLTVLREQPNQPVAHHRLAVIADKMQDFPRAEEHYLKAIESNASDPNLYSDLGYSYVLQGAYEKSGRYLKHALQLNPSHTQALNNLGLLYAKQGDYQQSLATFRRAGSESEAQIKIAQLFPQGPPANSAAPAFVAQESGDPVLGQSMSIQELMEQERQKAIAARQFGQQPAPMVNPNNPWPNSNNVDSLPQPSPEALASIAPQPGAFVSSMPNGGAVREFASSMPNVGGLREFPPPAAGSNNFEAQRQWPTNPSVNQNQPLRQPSDLDQLRMANVPDGQLNSVFEQIDRQQNASAQPFAGALPDYRQGPPMSAPTLQPWPGNPNLSRAPSTEGQWPQSGSPNANPYYPGEGARPAGGRTPSGAEQFSQHSGGMASGQGLSNPWPQPTSPSGANPAGQQAQRPFGAIDEPTRSAAHLGMSAGPGPMFSMPPNVRATAQPSAAPPMFPAPQQTVPGADSRINGAQFPAPLSYPSGQQFAEPPTPYGSQPPTAFRRSRPTGTDEAYWPQAQPPSGLGSVPQPGNFESSYAPNQPSPQPQNWGAPAQPPAPAWAPNQAAASNASGVDMLAEYEQQIRRHNDELNALKQTLEAQRQAPAPQTSWAAANDQRAQFPPPGSAAGSQPSAPNQFAPPNSFAAPMGTTPQPQW